jgi:hypothetical protein
LVLVLVLVLDKKMQVNLYSIYNECDLERIAHLRQELANITMYDPSNSRAVSRPIPIPNSNSNSNSEKASSSVEYSKKCTNMCAYSDNKVSFDSLEFEFSDVFAFEY